MLFVFAALSIGCAGEQASGEPVEFSKACDAQNNGKLIQVSGYLSEKGSMWCRGNSSETKCGLKLLQAPGSESALNVDLIQGSSANNIEKLERNYKPEDVKIHANDGSVIDLAAKVKVSGTMLISPENQVCNMSVTKIEK
jgi:hypothetical protein